MAAPSSSASAEVGEIDMSLYSRQFYTLGKDAMLKMQKSNVLIVGLGGLGCEAAKDIILTGVKSVTLADTQLTTSMDLSAQFYLTEADIGKNRAEACLAKLRELNQYVAVSAYTEPVTPEFCAAHFQVVIFTEGPILSLIPFNEACRKAGVAFVAAEARGVCSYIFSDFGNSHVVFDPNGETPYNGIVVLADQQPSGEVIVTVPENEPVSEMGDGDYVRFSEIPQLGDALYKVTKISPTTFSLGKLGHKVEHYGGSFVQVKQPMTMSFKSLAECMIDMQVPAEMVDWSKYGSGQVLHVGFQALSQFRTANGGRLPRPQNQEDAAVILELAKKINDAAENKADPLSEGLIKQLALNAAGNLSPLAAFIGGFVAQEGLKAISGKYTPIQQWFYFDSVESLPEEPISEASAAPTGSRYDGQIAVFGKEYQEKLANQKIFVVGAGALGCEYLKQLSIMGVACGPNGLITVTDMDTIETSNLSRQFLFRRRHVGALKSKTASDAVKAMNPNVNIVALVDKVGNDTEHIFTDAFWSSLNGVVNALDNAAARLYTDSKCVEFDLPLLESGTLGAKASTLMVVPHHSISYGSEQDAPEKEIPMCTLKSFPYMIEHCISWARDFFFGAFNQGPSDANNYLDKSDFLASLDADPLNKLPTLERVKQVLTSDRPSSFEDCIRWARLRFEEVFAWDIIELCIQNPADSLSSTGGPFWAPPKRFPKPAEFSLQDPLHLDFIAAAAILHAENYGIQPERNPRGAIYLETLRAMAVPGFTPKGKKILTSEAEIAEAKLKAADSDAAEIARILATTPSPSSLLGVRLAPIEFEKDDDSNFHMTLITAAANLRARNYQIPETDYATTKLKAGRIIPAMITTTALITGAVGLEFYKFALDKKFEKFRNCNVNLAINTCQWSEPLPSRKSEESPFTIWEKLIIDAGRDLTVSELIQFLAETRKWTVTSLNVGKSIVFMPPTWPKPNEHPVFAKQKQTRAEAQQATNAKYSDVPMKAVFELCGVPLSAGKQCGIINLTVNDAEGNEVELPLTKYRFAF